MGGNSLIALIDGDIVVYQAAARAEHSFDFGDDEIRLTGSKSETVDGIDLHIDRIKKAVGADRVLLCFTDKENFRKKVYPLYKSNRVSKRKPLTFAFGKGYVKSRYDTMAREGLEADDVMAIVATGNIAGLTAPRVVCSIDKDMTTFPCMLYNWGKGHRDKGVVEVEAGEADFNFYTQVLTGDSVDGYPGCPGVGPKTAAKLLANTQVLPPAKVGVEPYCIESAAWRIVVKAYKAKGLTEDDALAQARCARILRFDDYDFATKTPILWTPSKGEA